MVKRRLVREEVGYKGEGWLGRRLVREEVGSRRRLVREKVGWGGGWLRRRLVRGRSLVKGDN